METQNDNEIKHKLYRQKHNKLYYDKHKTEIINYIIGYNSNRRQNDPKYKQRINEYYKIRNKNNYDDEARQKKREYYLKKKLEKQQKQ